MATNKTLYQPVPDYRKFVDNQVLTNDQLNAVIDHLNYQDRLSRVLLSGVGIVCGLHISLSGDKKTIRLSDGVAITTDGNLLKTENTIYRGFKLFKDDKVKYPRFMTDENKIFSLWELETGTTPSDVHPLNAFESKTDFSPEEAVAVLYLEDYLKEEEECSPVDCDTQGREAINHLRVLLISPENVDELVEEDTIFSDLLPEESDTPVPARRMYAPRVVLTPANTGSYAEFKNAYDISFGDLSGRIEKLASITLFKDIFDQTGVNPVSALSGFSASHINFQYLYDFYKDLVIAYNELQALLKKNYSLCCPNPDAFPKHVLLGSLTEANSPWRHRFYPSPTHHHPESVHKLKKAFLRLLLMIKNFEPEAKKEIVITPSRSYDEPLGRRAIPFYYDLEEAEDPDLFYDKWKETENGPVPNYYRYNYPEGDFDPQNIHPDEHSFDPLDVCLEDHDFYRIEGHIGKNVSEAHKEIHNIQQDKGLAFDIRPVAIGQYPDEATIDYAKYRVYFEDLQVVLQAWNEEIKCVTESASRFLSGFSLVDPGIHINYRIAEVDEKEEEATAHFGLMGTANLYSSKKESATTLTFKSDIGTFYKSTLYKKDNAVIGGITKKEGTLGAGMIANDTIKKVYGRAEVIYNTKKELEAKTANWADDVKEAAFQIPVDLLGYLKETEDYKLTDIEDFTEENLQKYIKALKAQCKQTNISQKRLRGLVQKENSVLKSRNWINDYRYTLRRISAACCFIEKVKVLYEKILERKKLVLEQMVLDHFIEKHPGAEHKAGTPKGGTFILLYYSTQQESEKDTVFTEAETAGIREAELLKRMATSSDPNFTISGLSSQPPAAGFELSSIGEVPFRLKRDLLRRFRGRFERFSTFENIPHGTIIGDLCLPYICCSGTPATTFVFPEQLATLRLPVGHICMTEQEETDLIAMDVVPADGGIKAFIQKQELDGVILQKENGSFFDPNQVSPDEYGKIIRFEVNGQPVEPILILRRKPEASFTWSDNIQLEKNNTIAIVTFENTSTPFEELAFEWNFAGEVVQDENAIKFNHLFEVEPGKNFDFDVKLTAFNTSCSDTVSDTVSIDVPALEEPGRKTCYSLKILQCWGIENVQDVLKQREIAFENLSEKEMIAALLKNLRGTGGFTEDEINSSVLESLDRRRKLLSCLNIAFEEEASWEALGKLILNYQQENCGGEITSTEVAVDVGLLDARELSILADARNMSFVDGSNKNDLIKAVVTTESGNVFEESELKMLKNDTLIKLLDVKGIPYAPNDNKETLTRKLMKGSDEAAAVITVDTELLKTSELKNILGTRDVAVVDKNNKSDLLKVLNMTGEKATLKSEEVKLLKNETLRNVLDAKGISYAANDNKAILTRRLLTG